METNNCCRFCAEVEKVLREVCLLEVVASTLIICLLEYYCITEWENNDRIATITYVILLIAFTFNIFIFCYIGELLVDQVYLFIIFQLYKLFYKMKSFEILTTVQKSWCCIVQHRMVSFTKKPWPKFDPINSNLELSIKDNSWKILRTITFHIWQCK
ncbi:PREDICTED: uncharacterized protein LOC107068019 [Polistes dominula]|uniref:Uncharacterized protein LOC107068019 n=1 Tax=Polistes dominula TaxID=743375 RepID=A0ABM1IH10_POLDO|nr:PREDICTED: uncharacterized protein LOC107068019 [Polistes dominula]